MLIIAIDYSFNSIGITFRTDKQIEYVSIITRHILTTSKDKTNQDILSDGVFGFLSKIDNVSVHIVDFSPISIPKKIGLLAWERNSMKKYIDLNSTVYKIIKDKIETKYSEHKEIKVVFENYSYGSITDNLIQMVESTHKLKDLLCFGGLYKEETLKPLISVDNLFIVPSPEIKKMAGSGSFNKYDMLVSFSNNFNKDKIINEDKFRILCIMNRSDVTKNTKDGSEVNKPIDDLIDSYFLSLWLSKQK